MKNNEASEALFDQTLGKALFKGKHVEISLC